MIFEIPLKPCGCGVFLGEECDCAEFAASAARLFAERPLILRPAGQTPASTAAVPSTTYPTPLVLVLRDGRLQRVDGTVTR